MNEDGSAVLELAVCLPLVMAVIAFCLTLADIGAKKMIAEREASAVAVAYLSRGIAVGVDDLPEEISVPGSRVGLERGGGDMVTARASIPFGFLRLGPFLWHGEVRSAYQAIDPYPIK